MFLAQSQKEKLIVSRIKLGAGSTESWRLCLLIFFMKCEARAEVEPLHVMRRFQIKRGRYVSFCRWTEAACWFMTSSDSCYVDAVWVIKQFRTSVWNLETLLDTFLLDLLSLFCPLTLQIQTHSLFKTYSLKLVWLHVD